MLTFRNHFGADQRSTGSGCRQRGLRVAVLVILVWRCIQPADAASSLIGLWLTQNHEGIIAVAPCGGFICARIVGVFLDAPEDPMPMNHRGVSQCNLPLIADARQIRPNLWKGHITDPRNGRVYGVEMHLDPRGNLRLRGFLGVPLLGQTETWTQYPGRPPIDCRIVRERGTSRAGRTLSNGIGQSQ